jgi:hypothetical protein
MNASGGCLCGRVTFTAQEVEPHFHACHCTMCRRWAGGPGFAAAVGSVSFQGEQNLSRFDSSEWADRGFCAHCGSNLFYHLKQPDRYILWLGAFDDPAPFVLAGEIYIDEKPPGYALAGDHARLTGAEFLASTEQPG